MKDSYKMRGKDYWRLAKFSVKSRKKSTRNTVAGIAFGLILILPVLFFIFSFYVDFSAKINKEPTISLFSIHSTTGYESDVATPGEHQLKFVRSPKEVNLALNKTSTQDIVYFNNYQFANTYNIAFTKQDGTNIPLTAGFTQEDGSVIYPNMQHGLMAIDYAKSGYKIANDTIVKYMQDKYSQPLLSKGEMFSKDNDGKGELIISESYAKLYRLDVGDVIDMSHNGSFNKHSQYTAIDNDSNPNNMYVPPTKNENNEYNECYATFMKDYKIVGIISDKYYTNGATQQDPHLICTKASITDRFGNLTTPTTTLATYEIPEGQGMNGNPNKSNTMTIYTYNKDYSDFCDDITASGSIALLQGISTTISRVYGFNSLHEISFESVTRAQFSNYAAANKAHNIFKAQAKAIDESLEGGEYLNELFSMFSTVNMIGTIVISVLSVFGGVILFATMINLYNSIQYSAESRRNYIGMMRAVGAKNPTLYRMYFTEVLLIFCKAFIWIFIIGSAICVGLKFLFDLMMRYAAEMFGMKLSLSLVYLPVVLLLLVAFSLLIGFIYSQICCRPLTKQDILHLLKEDR